ncbi:MAG: hypothetical protein Q8N53_02015 [Longimicrobiales bacterium]|nr:hypothetical protein [Longimicrobiales bacterium]
MRHALLAALFASAALLLLSPPEAAAQARSWSDPTGFHVGVKIDGAAITYEDDDEAESGTGGALSLGWGLNNLVTLYLEGAGATVETLDGLDTYTLAHVDLGARFNTEAEYKGDTETIDVSATSARLSLGVSFWNGSR